MRRMMMRVFTGVTAAAVLGLTIGAPAHAAPRHAKHVLQLQIGCDNDQTYAAVTNGKGRFAPAHDVSSNTVLVPVAVSEALVTLLDENLDVVDQSKLPAAAKRGVAKHHKKSVATCDIVGFAPRPDGSTLTVQESMVVVIHHRG
jgi:hypothetical protein